MKKLNFSILGAGNISKKMAKTISMLPDKAVPFAVASRDIKRAKRLADRYGFLKAYDSYDKMLEDPEVDVVYVASPNSLHYEHVKLCLNHNKHVLCEKPFAVNEDQAAELFKMAKEKNLFVGEAMWTAFLPYMSELKKLLSDGIIGDISFIQVSFGSDMTRTERLTSPDLAGGALLDLGVYTIAFMMSFFGKDIKSIQSSAVFLESGVDGKSCTVLTDSDGKMAALSSDMTATLGNKAVIHGNKGRIEVDNFWCAESFAVYNNRSDRTEYVYPFERNGYAYEIEKLYEAINNGKLEYDQWTQKDTIRVLHICDQIRNEWKK